MVSVFDSFDFREQISAMPYGKTLIAYDKITNEKVVVKKINKESVGEEIFQQIEVKAKESMEWHKSSIVPYKVVKREGDTLYLVRSYIEGSPLQNYIEQDVSDYQLNSLWIKIVQTFHFLHSIGFFYNRIKPSNIIIHANNPLITDMYCSPVEKLTDFRNPDLFELGFKPPEFFTHTNALGSPADVWALGMLLIYIYNGTLPVSVKNLPKMIVTISSCEFDESFFMNMSPTFSRLLKGIFVHNPDERLDAEGIIRYLEERKGQRHNSLKGDASSRRPPCIPNSKSGEFLLGKTVFADAYAISEPNRALPKIRCRQSFVLGSAKQASPPSKLSKVPTVFRAPLRIRSLSNV